MMQIEKINEFIAEIAHELCSPLTNIAMLSQILIDSPEEVRLKDVKVKLGKIYNESMRMKEMVEDLLSFASSKKEKKPHDINEIIKYTVEHQKYSLRAHNIETVLALEPELPRIPVHFFQLQQVFVNLINNARDAMVSANGRGTLQIRSQRDRDRVMVSFRDSGPGIPDLDRIFEPFFTTKEAGKGTGLGLSISRKIITDHGGTIEASNHEGGGAHFAVKLPCITM